MKNTRMYLLPGIVAVMLALCLAPSMALASGDAPGGLAAADSMVAQRDAGSYKVVFKSNGGKGSMKAQGVQRGKKVALRANKFTRGGYRFVGWNTKANGKGKSYSNKAKVKNLAKADKTITLYAQWKKSGSSSHAATLSGKAKAAFNAKLGKIKAEANKQGAPPFGGSNKVMYRFLDVDGDGKKEMLVESSTKKGEISSYVHAAVYKYKAGKVKQVMTDSGWASWMGSFRCYYPKTRALVASFYHNSIRNNSMVYRWNGKEFVFASSGGKYKKGKVVNLNKGWKTYRKSKKSKIIAAYKKVLTQARNGDSYGGFKLGSDYGVFDMGADGTPELVVGTADQSWEGGYLFFEYSDGKARYIGYCWGGGLSGTGKGKLFHSTGRQGAYSVARVIKSSGEVKETVAKSFTATNVDDWDGAYSRCQAYLDGLGAKDLEMSAVTSYGLLNKAV